MQEYLREAFTQLNLLEADFDLSNLDKEKLDKLTEFVADDQPFEEEEIIDVDAETEKDLENTYAGKVILECECCHSRIYKDIKDVIIDKETELANINEECPVCNCTLGWSVIGKIEKFNPDDIPEEPEEEEETELDLKGAQAELDATEPAEESLNESFVEILSDEDTSWVDDVVKYGLAAKTIDEATDSEKKLVKVTGPREKIKRAVADGHLYNPADYSDDLIGLFTKEVEEKYEEPCDELEEGWSPDVRGLEAFDAAGLSKLREELDKAGIALDAENTCFYEYNNYRKAPVLLIYLDTDEYDSYLDKDVIEKAGRICDEFSSNVIIDDGEDFYIEVVCDPLEEKCEESCDKLEEETCEENCNESLQEDFKEVEIKTDDQKLEMTSDENGKVTVTTEPLTEEDQLPSDDIEVTDYDAEKIVPLNDSEEEQIEANSEEEPAEEEPVEEVEETEEEPAEEESEEEEVEEITEESFDYLANNFMKRTYHNVNNYKTTSAKESGNQLVVEGLITFNSGATKKTTFKFEPELLNNKQVRLRGLNETFSNRKNTFNVRCSIQDKKLIAESMRYNYIAKDKLNESVQIKGREVKKNK